MRGNVNSYPSSSYYEPYDAREPRRSAAPPRHRTSTRKASWPPSPAVEDESVAAKRELSSLVGPEEGEPPINTRGTVDQDYLLDEIEQPTTCDNDERRFVFAPGSDGDGLQAAPSANSARRRSFAERGNMPHLKTNVESDPPLFTKRVSTPYSYTPQKDSTAPASAAYMLSPEPITPANTSKHGTTSSRDAWDAQKDQNARPPKSIPVRTRRESFSRSAPQSAQNDVFDDSASEGESSAHLRTAERKPARYSFVKSDLQKEDLRANLRQSQPRPEPTRRDSTQRPPTARAGYENSSGSSKESSYYQSPRSSSSSVNSEKRKSRPAPVNTTYANSSHSSSRPSSPHRAPSPKLPSRLRESPPGTRPSSRGNSVRPTSPLSFSTTVKPPSPRQVPITQADWHATYPPVSINDRSRPPSRFGRHETIQIPPPRVDIQSPSPVRPPTSNPLPYPVEDHHADVIMPGEELYQFDHSTVSSPRQIFRDAPRVASPSIPNPSRQGDGYRSSRPRTPRPEDAPRMRRSRSNSADSKHSLDGRSKPSRSAALNIDRPLPSCPRGEPTDRYDDWYSLSGYENFDICPSCYDGVFDGTPFAVHFSQPRRYERPRERFCDFSSPWMRLAWLLTIKQRRPSLELLYALADVSESDRPCPGDRELSTERIAWYGIPDQRDGLHVANFAVCAADVKMLEILFPTVRGYFTRLPITYTPGKYTCSLRVTSRRFPKYLDLLVELDAEAQAMGQRPNIGRFVKLARENAFKGECGKDKTYRRKAWHFIPQLPEFTVCEECYDEVIWPALTKSSSLPRLVNKSIQLVPNEDPEVGSSCCLYSSRMRRVWDFSVKEEDFKYLERKVLERKRVEAKLSRQKKSLLAWLADEERGGRGYERAKEELRDVERSWKEWE
ncbi:hypothetical protein N0V94_004496 [Neodidymelliopsis sp. IMI 364377]|nr:hypothetical protein N0V94_004496 [Neodidymelliopsis sp. IMI 364377]